MGSILRIEETANLLGASADQRQKLKNLFHEVNADLASAEKTQTS